MNYSASSTLVVKMDNDAGETVISINHGFRIYSKNGSVWQTPTYAEGPDLATYLDFFLISPIDMDGFSEDTIGIWAIAGIAPGVPDGYEGLELMRISTRFYSEASEDTLCIDSTFYPPSSMWVWDTESSTVMPGWGGPYCWEIVDSIVCYAAGDINNDGLGLSVSDMIYLDDFINNCGPAPLVPEEADLNGDGIIDIADLAVYQDYFVYGISVFAPYGGYPVPCPCYATLEPVPDTVVLFGLENTSIGAACLEEVDGALVVSRCGSSVGRAPRGIHPVGFKGTASGPPAGSIAVVVEDPDPSGTLEVGASLAVEYTYAAAPGGESFPMESFFDLIATNTWGLGVTSSNPLYTVKAYNNDTEVFNAIDVDAADLGYIVETAKGIHPVGFKGTASGPPAGIIASSGYDFTESPSGVQWTWSAQSVSGMTIDFLEVSTDVDNTTIGGIENVSATVANIPSFTVLDIQTDAGGGGCCVGIRGNVNGVGEIDISDLVYMVDWMFSGGPAPLCVEEGDINGSGGSTPIDISDLVYLVDYMFTGGPSPVSCP